MINRNIDNDFSTEFTRLLASTVKQTVALGGVANEEALAATICGAMSSLGDALAQNMQKDLPDEVIDETLLELAGTFAQSFRSAYQAASMELNDGRG